MEEILNNCKKTFNNNRFGGLDIFSSNGCGVRYNSSNELMGFLQPK